MNQNGMRKVGLLTLIGALSMVNGLAAAVRAPEALSVEYLRDPVGLDTPAPRLSWKLAAQDAQARDLRQSAYQVLVASSAETRDPPCLLALKPQLAVRQSHHGVEILVVFRQGRWVVARLPSDTRRREQQSGENDEVCFIFSKS